MFVVVLGLAVAAFGVACLTILPDPWHGIEHMFGLGVIFLVVGLAIIGLWMWRTKQITNPTPPRIPRDDYSPR